MASSSVSQESLDLEDFENQAKRNRIRTHRGRGMIHRSAERECSDQCERESKEQNGDHEKENNCASVSLVQVDHDSPTRGAARIKDKRTRPNHLHKGKLPKDKRKLREKRRSTGVVHLPSTESTGDSLDDDDDTDNKATMETKKNTSFNESSSVDGAMRHNDTYKHSHHHSIHSSYTTRRNKSPSDLEADLEDNQDYDSTVSQSETNLTLIGQSESCDPPVSQSVACSNTSGVLKYTSKYTESCNTVLAPTSTVPDTEIKSSSSSATTAEILSRYRDPDYHHRESESPKKEIDGPRPFSTYSQLRENRGDIPYGSYLSRLRERDSTSPVHQRLNYITPRPFGAKSTETINLEKMLDKEKEENKKLKEALMDKDRRIAELEKEVSLLNRELDELDEENLKLTEQNSALIKAMSTLTTTV